MTTRSPFPGAELNRLTDRQTARIRLYCVPPSGTGSEFFLPWVAAFSELFDLVAVDLPGRGTRSGEPSITDIGWAATGIAEAIAADLRHRPPADGFYAVFGHSFGALLAFEATHRLRAESGTEPDLLALSAVPPPNRDGLDDHIARNLGAGISVITEIMGWEEPTDEALTRTVYTPFLADAVALLQHTRRAWPPLRAAERLRRAGRPDGRPRVAARVERRYDGRHPGPPLSRRPPLSAHPSGRGGGPADGRSAGRVPEPGPGPLSLLAVAVSERSATATASVGPGPVRRIFVAVTSASDAAGPAASGAGGTSQR
ncbi:thioesterase II family protein [Streptomyces hygroscopicus]|uniref:thioesterase II family protein n=1 Tax=Streptomyces hygroscopicus TaxID=1912 RepID=UPI0036A123AB